MEINKNYWIKELAPPYSPNEEDIKIYNDNLLKGSVLLLGCTHKLITLSDCQMDIDPWYEGSNVIVQEWTTNRKSYTNIIGDGVLNFTKEATDNLLLMCANHSKIFVARSFNEKLPEMKIANFFPTENDFNIKPKQTIKFDKYSFYIWNFIS